MYQLRESGRDAASGEQGLIDPVEAAEGTDRLLGQATEMLRSYLKENLPLPELVNKAFIRLSATGKWITIRLLASGDGPFTGGALSGNSRTG